MSTFSKKVTSAVAGLAVVFSMVTPIAGVSAAYNAADAADKLATLGVIVDQSANKAAYRLADTTSRQELSKIIVKLGGLEVKEGESVFKDTNFASWAEKYAKALNEAGYAASNDYFNPTYNATKIEALKWVMDARGIATGTGDNWMANRVKGAVDAGIATAFTDYNADVSRGQVFIWAANAVEAKDDTTVDESLCSILGTCPTDEGETPTDPVVTGDNEVTLSPESPANGDVAADTPRTAVLAFDVTAGSSDLTLKQATLDYTGLSDAKRIDEVSIYRSNEKVSKTKNFSDNDLDISFDKGIVVQAGETVTFTVAATIQGGIVNETHQVTLVALDSSEGELVSSKVVGATLRPVTVSNKATLKVKADKASDTVTVGEKVVLAGFELSEEDDNEDVMLKSVTLHVNGSIDAEDDLSNLELLADGKVVASNLMVNNDDEIVANLDVTIPRDEKVEFELHGVVTGSIGETVHVEFENADDIYAVGATTGINVSFEAGSEAQNADIADAETIEGSEINVSFEKSSVDEARPDAEDVLVGTLKLLAATDDYEVSEVQVVVTSSNLSTVAPGKTIADVMTDLELDGVADDNTSTENAAITATSATYRFDDIALSANTQEDLELTFSVEDDNAFNGVNLDFQVVITEVEDDNENQTYTSSSTPALSTILSSTSLDNKDIDIETGTFTITNVSVIDRELVIGNNVETVLYKAKISVGDADTVTLNDFDLREATAHTLTEDLDKVFESATLNIGGVTKDGDIDSDSIEFSSMNLEIAAGAENVEVLVTAMLKDNDSVNNNDVIAMELNTSSLDVEDSEGDALDTVTTTAANNKLTQTTLKAQGTFEFAIINNGDNKDDIESVVLAGSKDVALAEFKMEADLEDIEVESLKIRLASSTTVTTPGTVAPIALAVTQAVVDAPAPATPVDEVTKLTVTGAPTANGSITVNVNGNPVSVAVNVADGINDVAAAIQAAVNGDANSTAPATTNEVVIATAAGAAAGTNQVDATVNAGTTGVTVEVIVITQGNSTPTATPSVDTLTFNRGIASGETWDGQSTLAAYAANLVATDATIYSASVSGLVVTITGDAAGTTAVTPAVALPVLVGTPTTTPPSTSTVVSDISDTLTNIRLMDGATVIAEDGVATFVSGNTVVEFKDFMVKDSSDEIEGTLVADIITYDTNGDATSAVLGDVNAVAFAPADAVLEGEQSDNVVPATAATGNTASTAVAIVPATVMVSVVDTIDDAGEATVKFNIDTGDNVLDADDVIVTAINTTVSAPSPTVSYENDDNNTVVMGNPVSAAVQDGDEWTVSIPAVAANDGVKVKLNANGVVFSVNNLGGYTSSNDDEITIGTYTD